MLFFNLKKFQSVFESDVVRKKPCLAFPWSQHGSHLGFYSDWLFLPFKLPNFSLFMTVRIKNHPGKCLFSTKLLPRIRKNRFIRPWDHRIVSNNFYFEATSNCLPHMKAHMGHIIFEVMENRPKLGWFSRKFPCLNLCQG